MLLSTSAPAVAGVRRMTRRSQHWHTKHCMPLRVICRQTWTAPPPPSLKRASSTLLGPRDQCILRLQNLVSFLEFRSSHVGQRSSHAAARAEDSGDGGTVFAAVAGRSPCDANRFLISTRETDLFNSPPLAHPRPFSLAWSSGQSGDPNRSVGGLPAPRGLVIPSWRDKTLARTLPRGGPTAPTAYQMAP